MRRPLDIQRPPRSLAVVLGLVLVADVLVLASRTTDLSDAAISRSAVVSALAGRVDEQARTARYSVEDGASRTATGPLVVTNLTVIGTADFGAGSYQARVDSLLAGNRRISADVYVSVGPNPYPRCYRLRPTEVMGIEWQRARSGWQAPSVVNFGERGTPVPELGVIDRRTSSGELPPYARNPDERRAIIEALVRGVEDLGRARVHGMSTRHVRVTFDPVRAQARLAPALADELSAWDEGPAGPIDVWIDARRRLAGIEIRNLLVGQRDSLYLVERVQAWDLDGVSPPARPVGLPAPTSCD